MLVIYLLINNDFDTDTNKSEPPSPILKNPKFEEWAGGPDLAHPGFGKIVICGVAEWYNCVFSTRGDLFTFLRPTENRIEARARLLGPKIQKIPNRRRWAGGGDQI